MDDMRPFHRASVRADVVDLAIDFDNARVIGNVVPVIDELVIFKNQTIFDTEILWYVD